MQGADAANEALPLKSWDQVFQQALLHAQQQAGPLRWRGSRRGVLPHGCNANSIAAEALLDLLKRQAPPPNGHQPQAPNLLPGELRRLVWRHIDRLHHRKENFLTLNEPDLDMAFIDNDEAVRLIELTPSRDSAQIFR